MKSAIKRYVSELAIPLGVPLALIGVVALVLSLVATNLAVSHVLTHQGYENYTLAKPVAMQRVIRQTQVDRFGGRVSSAFGIKQSVATEFADWILEASERQDLAPELLASLVLTESSFRKDVRSNVGAVGPAQIRPDYWGSFCGEDDLHDPEQNIYCGAQILSHLLERCGGDRTCALGAYNVGPYANRANAAARYVSKVDRYQDSLEAAASL